MVFGGLQPHSGICVAENNEVAECHVITVGADARVQAVLSARQLQVLKSNAIGVDQLDGVAAAGGVTPIEQRVARGVSLVVIALNAHASVSRANNQVGGQVVRAVVHANDVARTQV